MGPVSGTRVAVRRPARRPRIVPDQHGAWAFLLLPVALALTVTPWSWLLVPATVTWVLAYPAAWALTGRLTAPRPARFDRALRLWPPLALVAGAPVLAARPWLVWVLLGYGGLWLVNLHHARQRRERSLGNDLVLVAECCVLIPVLVGIGTTSGGWRPPPLSVVDASVVLLMVGCLVTLTGSVLHVKSLIRERGDARYARAAKDFSVAGPVAVAVVAGAAGAPLWPALVLLLAGGRCWWVPRTWRPARVGLLELGVFVLVATSFAVAA